MCHCSYPPLDSDPEPECDEPDIFELPPPLPGEVSALRSVEDVGWKYERRFLPLLFSLLWGSDSSSCSSNVTVVSRWISTTISRAGCCDADADKIRGVSGDARGNESCTYHSLHDSAYTPPGDAVGHS